MMQLKRGAVICAGIVLCLTLVAGLSAFADDADTLKPDDTDKPTEQFDDMVRTTPSSSVGLATEAESAIKDKRFDHAIELVKTALKKRDDNLVIHQLYAEALEGKLSGQTERDPLLYNQCIREWLTVMRSEVGEESGINAHGAGGVFDQLYGDEDGYRLARYHLKQLTGVVPKPWETDTKYLARVIHPTHEVKAALAQAPDDQQTERQNKPVKVAQPIDDMDIPNPLPPQ